MPTTKRLLFVINSPQQQVNALILARKLAQVASQQGYQNSIISLDEFEVNESFDQVIVVGQRPKNLNILVHTLYLSLTLKRSKVILIQLFKLL